MNQIFDLTYILTFIVSMMFILLYINASIKEKKNRSINSYHVYYDRKTRTFIKEST